MEEIEKLEKQLKEELRKENFSETTVIRIMQKIKTYKLYQSKLKNNKS